MRNRANNEVNAGSMADIAFLLLIFFLVTTTIESDSGIDRLLPRLEDSSTVVLRDRNILTININKSGELLVEEDILPLSELKKAVIAFLDNGGDGSCDYCQGERSGTSSDNPNIAVVSLSSDRQTAYADYIDVQNEITAGYNFLRNREAKRLFGQSYTAMEQEYQNTREKPASSEKLKEQILTIQQRYPLKLSEAETTMANSTNNE